MLLLTVAALGVGMLFGHVLAQLFREALKQKRPSTMLSYCLTMEKPS